MALIITILVFHFDMDKLIEAACIAYKDKFNDKTTEEVTKIFQANFDIVQYVLIGCIGVLFSTWFFGFCYRWSIERNTEEKHFTQEKDKKKDE